MRDCVMEALNEVELRFESRDNGLSSGLPDYDKLTRGLHPGELTVVGSRPGMGKTSFLLGLVDQLALRQNVPVALFSLDKNRRDLTTHMLAAHSRVGLQKILGGLLTEQVDFPELTQSASALAGAKLFVDDSRPLTLQELQQEARELYREEEIGAIFIDQIDRLELQACQEREFEEIRAVALGLRELARELRIPIVATADAASDMRRSYNHSPWLWKLTGAGALERTADVVAYLVRSGVYAESEAERAASATEAQLLIETNRRGRTGRIDLEFDTDRLHFRNIPKEVATRRRRESEEVPELFDGISF